MTQILQITQSIPIEYKLAGQVQKCCDLEVYIHPILILVVLILVACKRCLPLYYHSELTGEKIGQQQC
jgi:hypothetical protein